MENDGSRIKIKYILEEDRHTTITHRTERGQKMENYKNTNTYVHERSHARTKRESESEKKKGTSIHPYVDVHTQIYAFTHTHHCG